MQHLWAGVGHGVFVLEVVRQGEEFRFVQFNPAIAQQLPQFPDRWLNQSLQDALGSVAATHRIHYQTCVHLGEPLTFEASWGTQADASWSLFSVSPWRQDTGAIAYLIVTAIEIGDRQRSQETHSSHEAHLRSLVETPNDWSWEINDQARYTYVSPQITALLGYRPEEILGKTLFDLMPLEETTWLVPLIQDRLRSRQPLHNLETRKLHRNGQGLFFETSAVPIFDETGIFQGYRGLDREIGDRKATENSLQQFQERLTFLIQSTPLGVIEWNAQFEVVGWNPAAEKIFGYTASEIHHCHARLLVPEAVRPLLDDLIDELLNQVGSNHSINENLTKDGRRITCEWFNTTLRDSRGQPTGIYSMVWDISDRVRMETALRQSRERLRSVISTAPLILFVLDRQGLFTFIDGKGLESLEGASKDWKGRSINDLYPNVVELAPAIAAAWSGAPAGWQCGLGSLWFDTRLMPFCDEAGQVQGVIGVAIDMTDSKRAQEALLESERRFRDVAEAAGEYIWECDAEGHYTFVTDRAEEVKGFPVEQLLGRQPIEFMLPEDIDRVYAVVNEATVQRQVFKLEYRNVTPTGEIVWEEVSGVPILDDRNEIIGWRGTSLSITKRKQAEAALRQSEAELRQKATDLEQTLEELQQAQLQLIQSEKMSSLGQLVAGVAHEINNPTSFIYGNIKHATGYVQDLLDLVELYQTHCPTPPAAVQAHIEAIDLSFVAEDLPKVLGSMKMGAERIKQIVLSLRNFSRMDEAEHKTVNLHEGIDSTLVILEHRLKANHARSAIQVHKHYGDLPAVDCFVGQLNQVFMNILSNGIDALEHGLVEDPDRPTPVITISTEALEADRVVIRIRDNGPGMTESVRQRLFDPFFTTKPVGQGTGMGLSISYQIVTEKHNGTLECQSEPGAGAEFVITLPIRQVEPVERDPELA